MKRTLLLAAAVAAIAGSSAAQAAWIDTTFTGTVTSETGTSDGPTVSGEFIYDTVTGDFRSFTIDGMSVAPGYDSSAMISPSFDDAIYTAAVSPVAQGGSINSTFSLDLSSLTSWLGSETAASLLTDTDQLATNLDTANNPASMFPSTFSLYTGNADGTNIVALTADLTSISSTVPEPASLALLATPLLGMGLLRRRRG